ncbi:MAG: hypothetical protein V7L25_33130 [Nostoc sp.]|uniref:hypothetical protein n=1 Tax=Nostoc sp. TaxID=1180 RepID=UPI002FF0F142
MRDEDSEREACLRHAVRERQRHSFSSLSETKTANERLHQRLERVRVPCASRRERHCELRIVNWYYTTF